MINIKAALEAEHSITNVKRLTNYIGKEQVLFDELMSIFYNADIRIIQRAAWVLGHVGIKNPQLLAPHISNMLDCLEKKEVIDAVKRNILRTLQEIKMPEAHEGQCTDICFKILLRPEEPAAIKAFAMKTLANICLKYPELADELCLIIKKNYEHESPAFRSRGRKVLKMFEKNSCE
jgi:hypothetical protein